MDKNLWFWSANLDCYCARHNTTIRADKDGGVYGGGGGGDDAPPPAPTAPDPYDTARESIRAQTDSLPDILAAQEEFGPQFQQQQFQQQLQSLQQYAPQEAQARLDLQNQFGPQFAEALRAEQEAASPELGAARGALTDYLNQPDLLNPEEERQAKQDIRGAQNVRGFALESGAGAQSELEKLTGLRQQLKERRLNIALSTSGRAPITGGSQFQGQQFGAGQLVQNTNPSQIFGLAQSNFGTQANIFGTQSANAQANSSGGIGGQLLGAGLGAFGGSALGAAGTNLGNKFF